MPRPNPPRARTKTVKEPKALKVWVEVYARTGCPIVRNINLMRATTESTMWPGNSAVKYTLVPGHAPKKPAPARGGRREGKC